MDNKLRELIKQQQKQQKEIESLKKSLWKLQSRQSLQPHNNFRATYGKKFVGKFASLGRSERQIQNLIFKLWKS